MSEKSKNPIVNRLLTEAKGNRGEADRLQRMIDKHLMELGELRARQQTHVMFAERFEQACKDLEAAERRRRLYGQEVVQ